MASDSSRDESLRLLHALNEELAAAGLLGRAHVAGGRLMCLAFDARNATRDIDASFEPSVAVLDAAVRVAARHGVPDTWLNDAVKGYLSDRGTWEPFLELSHLKVFHASAEYMLAMKCLAMRTGEAYHDVEDARYLLRTLGLRQYEEASEILGRYYSLEEYPETALQTLRELLSS